MSRFAPIQTTQPSPILINDNYQHGAADPTSGYSFISKPGLTKHTVKEISAHKNEPTWMLKMRLQALEIFQSKQIPQWGGDLNNIEFDKIHYYLKPTDKETQSWDDVPEYIKRTFEKIGTPQAEREMLAGVKNQFDSEVVQGSLKQLWSKQGVVFLSMDEGLKQYPDLVREYFSKVIPIGDNKFSALNTAVWSGGSFVLVPKGVEVTMPLQAYFRINADLAGQFERTLIIADEGSKVQYVEGCSSPSYSASSLHSAVVEIFVKKGARVQYTTVQNWYKHVYNLVTKRAWVEEEGEMVWTDFNMGCLSENARLFVENKGCLSIKDICEGDTIWSIDLQNLSPVRSTVVAKKNMGVKQIFRLTTENSREIEATENHPFLTLSKESAMKQYQTLRWRQLKDLKAGDFIATISGLPDVFQSREINFSYERKGRAKYVKYTPVIPKKTSEELLWLIGVYVGDGCSEKNKSKCWSRIYLAVPPDDKVRKRVEETIVNIFGIQPRSKGICVTISSIIVGEFFRSLQLNGTAKTKRIPLWIYDLPLNEKLAFIEGYMDSDGSVRNRKEKNGILLGQITYASANKLLLEDLKLLMISCGLNPLKISTYSKFRSLYKGKWKYYTCHFLTENLRDSLKLIREKVRTNDVNNIRFVRITLIEATKNVPVYDLEIQGTSNFVANGLIVHNSKLTMKYPSFILAGKGAKGETLSMALAGEGQHQDTGSKAIHLAPYTSSTITSKSISKNGGRTTYRGLVSIGPNAHGSKNKVVCDALILDPQSRSDTYPTERVFTNDVQLSHEATVSKIGEEQLFYLMSRGLNEEQASKMIVRGFAEPVIKKLPLEFAVEMNRLIDLEMEGSVG